MIHASAHGKLFRDPRTHTTKTGNPMATGTLSVSDGERAFLSLVAFGETAETLLNHKEGDAIAVAGKMQKNNWTDKEGNLREGWQIVVDHIAPIRGSKATAKAHFERAQA